MERIFRKWLGAVAVGSLMSVAVAGVAMGAASEPPPIGKSPCPDVRPGAHVVTSLDTGGTLNFLFRGSDGHRYVATAGHLFADEQTLVWKNDGPTAEIDDGTIIGRAAFAWNYNGGPSDFALIKLGPKVKSDPAMCYWGGPTGINKDVTEEPTLLRLYGNGTGIGAATPARTMVAPSLANESIVGAMGIVMLGDSGSPVISEDGRAVGVQFAVGVFLGSQVGTTEGSSPGNVGIYRLGPQLAAAERALGIRLKMMTAPLEP
ncbi:MAG: hypothetical protein QOK47_1396 [Actinomycetota bacterium]|nr:hypothetical protein [Actinomycetota bacterium]